MSGSEDFGPLMDVLVTCVGAVDVISVLALICNNGSNTGSDDSVIDINNNDIKAFHDDKFHGKSPRPMIVIDKSDNGDVINSLMSKVNELEAKVEELEVRSRECSMERFLDEERERFVNTDRLRRSQSLTPDHNSFLEHVNESNENNESATDESHVNSNTRDDDGESKCSSQVSQRESFEKETNDTDNCAQLAYHSDIDANGETQLHLIESIKEIPTCPKEIESSTVDVNENFIRMEQLQTQSPKMLMKQANVNLEDFPEETINELNKNKESFPIIATELKTVEDIMANANVSSHPKIEKFPKINEIETTDETAIELISTKFESPHVTESEELSNASLEPSVMVQSYAEIVATEEFIDEQVNELPSPPQNVEIINEAQSVIGSLMDVNINPSINLQTKDVSISANSSIMNLNASTASLQSGNTSLASAALDNDYAIRRLTPEPDVSIDVRESSIEKELLSPGGEGLKRTKRCINSLDRSASRSSSRLSRRSRKSKSPSVASEEDYKEWFDRFDNHLSSELTLPENDGDDDEEPFDSDMEEELLMDADVGNLDGAEICNIDEDRDVSVSITLNLKQKQPKQQLNENECNPCKEFQDRKVFKTKAEELEEMQRQWKTKGSRRLSILPSTDEQQKNYVSMLHPEEFPERSEVQQPREPHQHHQHLHNVGYSEWMKKMVDHHSCHLALDDSESDSDVPLDEVQMLPLFCDEQEAKKKQNRRRKK